MKKKKKMGLPWVPLAASCPGGTCLLGTHGLARGAPSTPLARLSSFGRLSLSKATTDSSSTPHTRRLSYTRSSDDDDERTSPHHELNNKAGSDDDEFTNNPKSCLSPTKGSPSACPHAVSPTQKLQPRTTSLSA